MKPETYLPKAVRILENLDLSKNYDQVIRTIFDHVNDVSIMIVTYNKGKSLIRARPMQDGEPRFKSIQDFSYKPQHLNTTYQRASTPNRTMFYAATIRDGLRLGEIDSARVIGLVESMPWILDKSVSGIRKLSYGKWINHEPLQLLAIVNQAGFHNVNSFAKEVYDAFLKNLARHSEDYKNAILKFSEFMANEFSKEIRSNLEYQISAIFSDMMCNHSKIDGILYPSFKMDGQGLNIAIKPEAMNKLGLYAAGEFILYKNKEKTVVGNSAAITLDGKTPEFEMLNQNFELDKCLEIIGINSIEELKAFDIIS